MVLFRGFGDLLKPFLQVLDQPEGRLGNNFHHLAMPVKICGQPVLYLLCFGRNVAEIRKKSWFFHGIPPILDFSISTPIFDRPPQPNDLSYTKSEDTSEKPLKKTRIWDQIYACGAKIEEMTAFRRRGVKNRWFYDIKSGVSRSQLWPNLGKF